MDWSSLELKVISCRDLKAFNFFKKLSAYSVVSIMIMNEQAKKKEEQQKHVQRQKTCIRKGGRNPEWNHIFQFDLRGLTPEPEESDNVFLKFDLRSESLVDRRIGEVRVPLKDLIDEFCGVVRYVSYQVRNSDGKANGVLNFSYRLIERMRKSGNHDSSSPEKVVYPKVEHVDYESTRDYIRYPSLDDHVYNPKAHSEIILLAPLQQVSTQGARFLDDPSSRSSAVAQPSPTYCYRNQGWMVGINRI